MPQERAVYTTKEVGELMGLSKSEAYNLMYSDSFPSFKLNGRWKVAKADFWKWLDKQKRLPA